MLGTNLAELLSGLQYNLQDFSCNDSRPRVGQQKEALICGQTVNYTDLFI